MNIKSKKDDGSLALELEGRLDTITAPQLDEILKQDTEGCGLLILDFDKVEYISSAGLRVILSAQKLMNKQGRMVVKNVNSAVMEVFEITGFSDILNIE